MHRHKRQPQANRPAGNTRHADESSERVSMGALSPGSLSPASLPVLQRAIGNAAMARMMTDQQNSTGTRRHDGLSVQRAPSAGGEASSQKSAQPNYTFADVKGANPSLWTDLNDNYWVGSGPPPEGFIVQVEQHCGYMATYWLTHGHGTGGLRFADLDEPARILASDTVRRWGAVGGRQAQVDYAAAATGGHEVSRQQLDNDAAAGTLPAGSLIWFGSDAHAEAAVVTTAGRFLMYDPNTGETTTRDANAFRTYIETRNSFVVMPGPDADPKTCQCCIIM